ncbi:hypothetical protein [Stenotrophomonas phage A1432]|uniref:Uncharacterized protein n=1 Tax=Stenotrophomonas phage A1432 TaxID=2930315 RepID=A0A9E7N2Q2_9CAUD|nr:hypothetical protein P9A45_gp06 [Stenotrophomonas phage A1432]UTC27948.1 hypothetical protein [Stenotrophomonas phage A1432]
MKSRVTRRAHQDLIREMRCTRTRVYPVATQGLFNSRCFENVVEWLRVHPGKELDVVECMVVEDGYPILHYLVRDVRTGQLQEVTLGWRIVNCEVYLLRTVDKADHLRIHDEFDRSLYYWASRFVHPLWRKLLGITRIC